MRKFLAIYLSLFCSLGVAAQTPAPSPRPPSAPIQQDEEVLRITTELVQVDAVVVDKNDQPVTDLKMGDFEVYDNGKKQELQFMEFVSVDAGGRSEGAANVARIAPGVDASVAHDLSAHDVRRVIAFVVDDVTIPGQDLAQVRRMLNDFIDTKMGEGDLVAIIRTFGGKGLLEQFTNDKQILRRAVSQIAPRSIPPYLALTANDQNRAGSTPSPASDISVSTTPNSTSTETVNSSNDFDAPSEGTNQVMKGILALSVSDEVIKSLREIPGRKSLVLISGGLPLIDMTRTGSLVSDVTPLFNILKDDATRSGVVVNTLDVRGVGGSRAMPSFAETQGKSALGGGMPGGNADRDPSFGRGASEGVNGASNFSDQLGLSALASATGGVSVANTNNFVAGLDRVLARSRAYYRLAYRPSQPFDNKFHKYEIKVRRPGARVYTAQGYFAHEDKAARAATKEQEIVSAARSPLARRDLDVAADLQYRFTPESQAQLDINVLVDAHKLNFTRTPDGKYQASFDVAGFVLDQLGRTRGGISQTVNASLTEQEYKRALASGIGYTASTVAPPGYYQVRLVVREAGTGSIGTVSRYFEVPDLASKRLTMSSLFLYAADPSGANPQPLSADRVISRKRDLRYAAIIYNPKAEGGKSGARARIAVSQNNKVLFQEQDQPVEGQLGGNQIVKIGQLALSKVPPGRYVLTLVVTDPLADKNKQIVARSLDFTVVD
jgi:VWFA-related protein